MTHGALSPFSAWSTPPNRLGLASPQPLSMCPVVSQLLCAQNVWPTLFRLAPKSHGFLDANTIPRAHSPSCNFHILPKGDQQGEGGKLLSKLRGSPHSPCPLCPSPLPNHCHQEHLAMKTPSLQDLLSDMRTKANM